MIARRTVYSTMVALAAAGLAAGCASTSSTASASPGSAPSAACASSVPSASASPPAAADARPALDAIQFADADHGWAADWGRIVATTDAGQHWTRQYSGSAYLSQIDFTDDEHGWAAGQSTLLRTTDGGATWTALTEPCQGWLNSIHFVSPALGYAVAAAPTSTGGNAYTTARGGSLLRSTDGGATWTALAGAPANPQSACFSSAADGYVGTPGHIWRSTDGGRQWTLALTEPGPSRDAVDPPAIECAGDSGLWVTFYGATPVMSHDPYLVYATSDGRQWHGLFEDDYTEAALRPAVKLPEGPGSFPGPVSPFASGQAAFVGYNPATGYGTAPLALVSLAGASGNGASGNGTSGTGTSNDDRRLTSAGNVAAIDEPLAASFLTRTTGWVVGAVLKPNASAYDIEATANSGRTWTTEYTTP